MILRWLLYVLRMDQEKSLFVLYPTNFLLPTCSMRPINSGVLNISLKQKKHLKLFKLCSFLTGNLCIGRILYTLYLYDYEIRS